MHREQALCLICPGPPMPIAVPWTVNNYTPAQQRRQGDRGKRDKEKDNGEGRKGKIPRFLITFPNRQHGY